MPPVLSPLVSAVCRVLRSIRDDLGTTVLFVEQNLDTILTSAERGRVAEKGRVVARLESGEVSQEGVRRHSPL